MYYVYLVCRKRDFQWYVGYTSDLRARIQAHNQPETLLEGKFDLIYYEAYLHKLDAIRRECFLKSGSGRDFLKRHLMYFLRTKLPEFRVERQPSTHHVLLAAPEPVQG